MTEMPTPDEGESDSNPILYGLLQLNQSELQHLAWKATIELGYQADEIVVVCVQVDSIWRFVADRLMPDAEEAWEASRARGEEPNVIGTMQAILCDELAERYPNLESAVSVQPAAGMVRGMILAEDSCLMIEVEPQVKAQS